MAPTVSNDSLVLYLDVGILFSIFVFSIFGFPRLVARLSLPHCEGFILRNAKPLATKITLANSLDKTGSDESDVAPYKIELTDSKSLPDRNNVPKLPIHIPSYSTWLHPLSTLSSARYDGYSVGQYTILTAYLAAVAVAMFLFSNPVNNCTRAGFVCISQAPIVVLFGVKNGPVGTLLGKSYEKLNYIHRWVGQLMFVSALFHVVGYLVKWTKTGSLDIAAKRQAWGWFAFGGLVFLTVISLPPIRQSSYTLFWHAHWIGFLLFTISIMYHAPGAVPYAIAALSLYALDQVMRLFKSRVAIATITPLSIPKLARGWRAGQHVRVRVLNSKMGMLGWAESHPFTIASISSPKGGGDGLTLLIKKTGDWTESLYTLSHHTSPESASGPQIKVVIEGPYGGPGSTIPSSFSSGLVVVGGSGITFGTSTVEEWVAASENGCSRTGYVELVWVVQDHSAIAPLLPAFATLLSRAKDAHMTLSITVHYTRATDAVPSKLPFGVRIVAGRPNLSATLDNVLKRTEMLSTRLNPAKGVMIGVCGPVGLAEEVWKVQGGVDGEVGNRVGGVEVYEDITSNLVLTPTRRTMGNMFSQIYPPKSLFTVDQIPDLTGQVMIVTGGNTGIGKETCKALLNKNAKVYLAARSKSRADEAVEWLKQETDGKVPIFLELDLANLSSIRKAVETFKSQEQELHVLFNNAGVMRPPVEQRTKDGYDLQFGTNVLGHYFFTTLLLPTLIHTAKNSPQAHGHARVINTSSSAVYLVPEGGINWETLGTDEASVQACKRLGSNKLYAQSKLGNVLFSNELAKNYADQGIISSSLNPGSIQTDLQRHLPWPVRVIIDILFHHPASYGALTQLWSGTMPEGVDHTGKLLIPWARVGDPGQYGHDEQLARRLWTWLEEQVKGH